MGANTSSPKERLSLSDLRSRKSRTASKVSPFIVEMKNENQWKSQFNALKDTNKLLVIEFTAKWCGPCQFLEPKLEDLAAEYTNVEFVKIDVDVIMSVWKEYNLYTFPAVVFTKRGQEVDRVVGLKLDEIEGKLHKYAYSF
ncbi:Thioredoxin H8 [Raphanus sativus]|uniref:Thioredoxin H8-like n=1 Tax=Raphanus sativus TaxID=3726 RepID=A0A6J0KDM3_RAPSA|nr:thioredoxin H8-like [Raphanus sativus]KAJ4884281.1 Thioredoxin H8 [Raphanus sativus]